MRFVQIALIAISATLASPVEAQDYYAGALAHSRGDYATAVEIWRPIAERGDADAQAALARAYQEGEGVPQDYSEAARWLHKAAKQGVPFAQASLGYKYRDGKGVLQDFVLAHMWFNIVSANSVRPNIFEISGRIQRDAIEKRMTPEQVSNAQTRARVCMSSKYENCD